MRILFVCTGNICRSPIGERLTRAYLDDALGPSAAAVGTSSAGTHAVVGSGMEPSSALALGSLGASPDGFQARQLTGELIDAADLTLTMTRRHRRASLKAAPRAMFRTFTLLEAADLLGRIDVAALPPVHQLHQRTKELVTRLGEQRATRRQDVEADDIMDPMGASPDVHQQVGEQIFQALTPLLQAMCGAPGEFQRAPMRAADDTIVATRRLPAPPPVRGRHR